MRPLLLVLAAAAGVACAGPAAQRPTVLGSHLGVRDYFASAPPAPQTLAPGMPARQAVLARATEMLGIPYAWGGDSVDGLDCSAYVSAALFTPRRQTTDTLIYFATVIDKERLLPGDLLDFETWDEPTRSGHVRMFAAWGDPAHETMWVFESRYPEGSLYHLVRYDDRYEPLRYDPLLGETGTAELIAPAADH